MRSFFKGSSQQALLVFLLSMKVFSCGTPKLKLSDNQLKTTGQSFYEQIAGAPLAIREELAIDMILSGSVPSFLQKLVPVKVAIEDPLAGKQIRATFFVMPDYVSVGTSTNWARVPLSPMAAQVLADSLGCFLPTAKMVDAIWEQAAVRLDPVPMYAFRDSSVTFWQHHLIIEGQREGRKGLIAGIKKDVVLSARVATDPRPNRVAIYGWHRLNGKVIQPLYVGHVRDYVDYSHGVRLVWKKVKVRGKWMEYTDLLADERLKGLLCAEDDCSFWRYATED